MDPAGSSPGEAEALKRRFRRGQRARQIKALALIAPLFLFLLLIFLLPIGRMISLAVKNEELRAALPATTAALRDWDGTGQPPPSVLMALIGELPTALAARTLAVAAQRLNHEAPGMRSVVMRTARALTTAPSTGDPLATLMAADPAWAEPETWLVLRRAAEPWTDLYLLAALDLRRDAAGKIVAVPPSEAIFVDILVRTFAISGMVTLLCLLLGFPISYLMAQQPPGRAALLIILVLLPFWTSLLVRISAWVVLLQNEGIINGALLRLHLIETPLPLMYNRFGVVVAMTHVLLPFLVLPLYSVMRGISATTMRAAASLGAPPPSAFLRVYLPQAAPGVAAGCLLVFILAIGYYITPALVGGAGDQMISYFIAFYTNRSVNWGLAAALATLLLAATAVLYAVYSRLAGSAGMKLG